MNLWEEKSRLEKATRLMVAVDTLLLELREHEPAMTLPEVVVMLESPMAIELWSGLAREAGTYMPSAITRGVVLSWLRARTEARA